MADFHGDITDPKLVLYVGGNYFFAMGPLVVAFEKEHRDYKGRIYWETIPPGLLVKQLEAGGTITSGNMTWTAKPDAYFAGLKKVDALIGQGLLTGPAVPYATNTLTIMVPKDNPGHVTGLADLGKPDIRLAMPNPEFEGIARQIEASLKKAGGQALADAVYKTKVADGSTILTHIHHRQTPLFLMQGHAEAGATWQSEAMFQAQAGPPIAEVDIPTSQNTTVIYAGAVVKGAPHPEAAKHRLSYIHSPQALAIFEHYGFKPYTSKATTD
ncbi:MAG: putative sulfate-binding protein [Rhodospirillales bacterium]|nr:putative sulfate-binding protein [Rhodospirillales bacterium]